jgi:hypothetical protein
LVTLDVLLKQIYNLVLLGLLHRQETLVLEQLSEVLNYVFGVDFLILF